MPVPPQGLLYSWRVSSDSCLVVWFSCSCSHPGFKCFKGVLMPLDKSHFTRPWPNLLSLVSQQRSCCSSALEENFCADGDANFSDKFRVPFQLMWDFFLQSFCSMFKYCRPTGKQTLGAVLPELRRHWLENTRGEGHLWGVSWEHSQAPGAVLPGDSQWSGSWFSIVVPGTTSISSPLDLRRMQLLHPSLGLLREQL